MLLYSGLTTIERPHGAGTLVIRPHKPTHQKPLPPSTTTKIPSQSSTLTDLDTAASIAGSKLRSSLKKDISIFCIDFPLSTTILLYSYYRICTINGNEGTWQFLLHKAISLLHFIVKCKMLKI